MRGIFLNSRGSIQRKAFKTKQTNGSLTWVIPQCFCLFSTTTVHPQPTGTLQTKHKNRWHIAEETQEISAQRTFNKY